MTSLSDKWHSPTVAAMTPRQLQIARRLEHAIEPLAADDTIRVTAADARALLNAMWAAIETADSLDRAQKQRPHVGLAGPRLRVFDGSGAFDEHSEHQPAKRGT